MTSKKSEINEIDVDIVEKIIKTSKTVINIEDLDCRHEHKILVNYCLKKEGILNKPLIIEYLKNIETGMYKYINIYYPIIKNSKLNLIKICRIIPEIGDQFDIIYKVYRIPLVKTVNLKLFNKIKQYKKLILTSIKENLEKQTDKRIAIGLGSLKNLKIYEEEKYISDDRFKEKLEDIYNAIISNLLIFEIYYNLDRKNVLFEVKDSIKEFIKKIKIKSLFSLFDNNKKIDIQDLELLPREYPTIYLKLNEREEESINEIIKTLKNIIYCIELSKIKNDRIYIPNELKIKVLYKAKDEKLKKINVLSLKVTKNIKKLLAGYLSIVCSSVRDKIKEREEEILFIQ